MDSFYLDEIVSEILPLLCHRRLLGMAQSGSRLLLDFAVRGQGPLVISLSPGLPGAYLSSKAAPKRVKDWSPALAHRLGAFAAQAKARLEGAVLIGISKAAFDRIVSFEFRASHAPEERVELRAVLTGRSANCLLLDAEGQVQLSAKAMGHDGRGASLNASTDSPDRSRAPADLEETDSRQPASFGPQEALQSLGENASIGEIEAAVFGSRSVFSRLYRDEFLRRAETSEPLTALRGLWEDLFTNPRKPVLYSAKALDSFGKVLADPKTCLTLSCIELRGFRGMREIEFGSFSAAAEAYVGAIGKARDIQKRYDAINRALESRLKKQMATLNKVNEDLAALGDAGRLKHFGDLLLTNIHSARIEGDRARVRDYCEQQETWVEVDLGDAKSIQKAAAAYYDRYKRAQRGRSALEPRAEKLNRDLEKTRKLIRSLREDATLERIEAMEADAGASAPRATGATGAAKAKRQSAPPPGRRFLSAQGYEILVGRNDSENDRITFRVAGSMDLWLHAADYPGSHVVIRNPSRGIVPHETVLEAARIAAHYSQARKEKKAAVSYTQKKFVSKPPRAKAGLVRISSFKTVLVEPGLPE